MNAAADCAAPRPPRRARRWLVLFLVIGAAGGFGCASRFVRPTGAAMPDPAAVSAWEVLSASCREVSAVRTELRVSGDVEGSRFPSLTTGLAADATRLAAAATYNARPVFHLGGTSDDLTLLDHMERRVIQGPAPRIVDALVGVRMGPDRLLALLTGCVSSDPSGLSGVRVGGLLRVDLADSRVYLAPADDDWRLRAAEFDDVLVDYRRIEGGWPREIELRRGSDVRLRLRVIELDRNPILPAALFQLTVPASYIHTPVDALDEERLLDSSDARVPVVPEG